MPEKKPRIVASERVFKGWNSFEILTVEAAERDGSVRRHRREVVDHGDAAVVLPIDRARGVALLVRQWRAGLLRTDDPYLIEACAGILDPGESPEAAARREAEEEVGLKVGTLRSLGVILPSIGTLTERMHLFVAEVSAADRTENGGGLAQEGENIEVLEIPLAELFDMARQDRLTDAKTLVIVQRLMLEEAGAA
jgi:nudix-type nucleoside diphosphatase (YffH/AdpP family)